MVTLAAYIEQIKSDRDGGFTVKLVVSQSGTEQIKALIDHINKTVFTCSFDNMCELPVEKRSPGRPKKDAE